MKYLGWIVACAMAMLALAGDPTCPADIDSDSNVGTSDLLQVLADWGPCPAPTVVDLSSTRAGNGSGWLLVRTMSDGTAELLLHGDFAGLPDTWIRLPDNANSPRGARPISIGHGTPTVANLSRVYRQWSNGTVDYIEIVVNPPDLSVGQWMNVGE